MPLNGVRYQVARLMGVRRSSMNPNICSYCEGHFLPGPNKRYQSVMATILFVDIRGYTTLSLNIEPMQMAQLLSRLYDEIAHVIWAYDGVVNKFIGDAALAIFNFPIVRPDSAMQAVEAGQAIIQAVSALSEKDDSPPLGVGVGIHTGEITVGKIGEAGRDLTAIGPTVNMAARLQSVAQASEVLVSGATYAQLNNRWPNLPSRTLQLKGILEPVTAYAIVT